jgi:hypothetical protein
MKLESNNAVDERIRFFLEHAHTIKALFKEDVDFTVTDREQVLEHLLSKELEVEKAKGRVLNHDEPIMEAIRSNKRVRMDIPAEYYGTSFTAVMIPIQGENGEVVGAISVSTSTNKQETLKEVAEKFSSSSQEISSSTEELTISASNFNEYINDLMDAQKDMQEQVKTTTKILEMINGVAKNTRVLGFNAGIEAARSGEHGRGFAVVAKEVTRLADESANSVNEIKQLLEELNDKVENVAHIVENTVQLSKGQTTVIEEISQAIQYLTDGAEEVEEMAKNI